MLRQSLIFLLVGLLQLSIDVVLFLLMSVFGVPIPVANILSRGTAALTGFWINGNVTFASSEGGQVGVKSFGRFAILWTLLTLVSTLMISLAQALSNFHFLQLGTAKIVIEAGLIMISFAAQRLWVYKNEPRSYG